MGTDDDVNQRIAKWVKYAHVGSPDEMDYGSDKPSGIKAAGLESQYEAPQCFTQYDPQLVATKADYDLVESIYAILPDEKRKHVSGHYYGKRRNTRLELDAVHEFRELVRIA